MSLAVIYHGTVYVCELGQKILNLIYIHVS